MIYYISYPRACKGNNPLLWLTARFGNKTDSFRAVTVRERSKRNAKRGLVDFVARDPDCFNGAGVLDICQRIAAEHDQIRPLALLEGAQILCAKKFRRILGGDRDDLHRGEAGIGH